LGIYARRNSYFEAKIGCGSQAIAALGLLIYGSRALNLGLWVRKL
jgi:hypothetical protein